MNKIKIGFLTYKIVDWKKDDAEEAGFWGTHSSKHQIIKTDNSLSKERKKEVLLHEIFHAIWDQWFSYDKDFTEENVVKALAMGLTTVFKDNPELKKELF